MMRKIGEREGKERERVEIRTKGAVSGGREREDNGL